ncbi:hypothetical protein K3G39_15185 [Pontibacter sp. HSC-14F20]|uniref:hypothetical protein n=1 Tax=Pontibacter sp. HSC-14F20 TaxID=2864136 RepID=UPI001C72C764|nr:hypothetical protein [Pontibacter sp. HSC-14F20]MBX0334584.1 hypothetical protein [Pontibacter sp. HSC-14F20]
MKKQWISLTAAFCLGSASLLLTSCGSDNQQSVPDNQSIETRDIDSDSLEDNRAEDASGGTGTDASGTTSGSTTGGTTM